MGPSGLSASGQILKVWNSDRREYRNEQHQLQCMRITRLKPPTSTSSAQSLPIGSSVASGSGSSGAGGGGRGDVSGVASGGGGSATGSGSGGTQATCLAVDEGLALLAIGFQNGTVQLFRGDITRDKCALLLSSSFIQILYYL